jgi:hypothetical protein
MVEADIEKPIRPGRRFVVPPVAAAQKAKFSMKQKISKRRQNQITPAGLIRSLT